MADFVCVARTNYFRVKDLDAFRAALTVNNIRHDSWAEMYGYDTVLDTDPDNSPHGSVALFFNEWPSMDPEEAESEWRQNHSASHSPAGQPTFYDSVIDLIAAHLVPSDVAVYMGVGREKMRYLDGVAVAVDHRGQTVRVSLDDIYDMARTGLAGDTVTIASH